MRVVVVKVIPGVSGLIRGLRCVVVGRQSEKEVKFRSEIVLK